MLCPAESDTSNPLAVAECVESAALDAPCGERDISMLSFEAMYDGIATFVIG